MTKATQPRFSRSFWIPMGNRVTASPATVPGAGRLLRGLHIGGLMAFLLLALAADAALAYEQRPNTVSLGLQGGAGHMSGSGAYPWKDMSGNSVRYYYGDFDFGPSLGIRVRYSLDRTHAIGISWEDQRYRRKTDKPSAVADSYQVTTFAADYYAYLNRPRRLSQYVVLGAGFYWDTFRFEGKETDHGEHVKPPEAPHFFANLGLGAEYFLSRPFSIDMTLRGYYMKGEGGRGLNAQLQLGFQYYVLQ